MSKLMGGLMGPKADDDDLGMKLDKTNELLQALLVSSSFGKG